MVPEMCQLANISGHKTNHSLRATGATALYEAEVPEKIIQERTGHRSLEGLRVYERTSEKQHQAVSNILSSSSQSTYLSQIKQLDCSSSTSTSNVSGVMPKMNFNGCQVNINFIKVQQLQSTSLSLCMNNSSYNYHQQRTLKHF